MERTCLHILVLSLFVLLNVDLSSGVRQSGTCDYSSFPEDSRGCTKEQFSCINGTCIPRTFYCDNQNDCGDNSDEMYCKAIACPKDPPFMKCKNTKCIPVEWWCDGKTDCPSGDDEKNCGSGLYSARINALNWLLNDSSSSASIEKWGYFSSKAVVALHLAESEQPTDYSPFVTSSRTDMADGLSIQLLSQLAHKRLQDISSTDLSSFVNAFLVTCLDPRQFHGMDLVRELRLKVDRQNYTNPYDLLTLCNAGDTITALDEEKLTQAFQSNYREFWTDMKSIAVMGLACAAKQPGSSIDSEILKEFTMELKTHQYRNGTVESLQTTALVMQALYAVEPDEDPENFDEEKALQQILAGQKPDGSFGSLMKTYYILPVLSCKSLVNISSSHCEFKQKDERTALQDLMNQGGAKIRIHFSLWIGDDKDVEKIMALKVPINSSFYRIIEIAADIDNRFRFEYVTKNRKPFINGIYGILDDPERGKFWFSYRIEDRKPALILKSPADVYPKSNDHLVMWYRSGSWVNRNFSSDLIDNPQMKTV